jgi:hypothetical protein
MNSVLTLTLAYLPNDDSFDGSVTVSFHEGRVVSHCWYYRHNPTWVMFANFPANQDRGNIGHMVAGPHLVPRFRI